jgi:uncharacterized protein (TIGR00251 family)
MSEGFPVWLTSTKNKDVFRISIYAQPGARSSGITGEFDQALKIKILSPPVDGAANEALTAWIAQILGIKRANVRLVQGMTSRRKVLEVTGIDASEICRKLVV